VPFFTLISKYREQCQILLFLLCVAALLGAVATWNQANWTPRQKERTTREDVAGRLDLLFENGNISPRVSMWLYEHGISTRPRYSLVGRDGWMFLGDRFNEAVSRASHIQASTSEDMAQRWAQQLRERQDWLAARGIPSLFAVIPNKHSIYPEQAPPWLPFMSEGITDQLIEAGRALGVNVIDTRQNIRQQKCCRQWLYNRSDTHWTAPGAYLGYQDILTGLQQLNPILRQLPQDQVTFRDKLFPSGGLARLLGFSPLLPDDFDPGYDLTIDRTLQGACIRLIERDFEERAGCKPVEDRPIVGNYQLAVKLENPGALNAQSLLVIEDSFGQAISRYYNHSFATVWHAHLGWILNGQRLRSFIERYPPDLVVYAVVERNILHPIAYEFDDLSDVTEALIE
jgi:hypothetical protein